MKFRIEKRHCYLVTDSITKLEEVADNLIEVEFEFDAEWSGITKTARFSKGWEGEYVDKLITNGKCSVSLPYGEWYVGVMSTNLTTTPCKVEMGISEKSYNGYPAPAQSIYQQILDKLDSLSGADPDMVAEQIEAYFEEHPIDGLTDDDVNTLIAAYLEENPQGVDETAVNNLIASYLTANPQGLSESSVNSLIASYLTAHPQGVSESSVNTLIANYLTAHPQGLSESAVNGLIASYLTSNPQGLSETAVNNLIASYLTAHPQGVDESSVNNLIAAYITAHPEIGSGGGNKVAYAASATSDTIIKIVEEEGEEIDLSDEIADAVEDYMDEHPSGVSPILLNPEKIEGYFIDNLTNIQAYSGYYYTKPFFVPSGAKVIFHAKGFSTNVKMICKADVVSGKPTASLVTSVDASFRDYEYTANEDMYVICCGQINANNTISIILSASSTTYNTAEWVESFDRVYYGLTPMLTAVSGYFIHARGSKEVQSLYSITQPIMFPPKTHIKIHAQGYLTNVAMIAKYDVATDSYSPLVISSDSTTRDYEYTTTTFERIVFSYRTSAKITCSLTCESTIVENYGKFADYLESQNKKDFVTKTESFVSFSMFKNFGVIGDSFASGALYDGNGASKTDYGASWGQILARKSGNACTNYSFGGASTRNWLAHTTKGLPKMLSDEAKDLYIIAMGINDVISLGRDYIGSIDDINDDFSQNADTFYGNMGKIIGNIKSHAPNARIILATLVNTSETRTMFSNAIKAIATHFEIPYIEQDNDSFFKSAIYRTMIGAHPTSIGYGGMSNAFERLICKCVEDNFEYFKLMYAE